MPTEVWYDAEIAKVTTRLADLESARDALRFATSYSVGGQSFTREDRPALQSAVDLARRELAELEAGKAGARNPSVKTASWRI